MMKKSALDLVGGYDHYQAEVNKVFRNSYDSVPIRDLLRVEKVIRAYDAAEMPTLDLLAMVNRVDQIWTSQGLEAMFGFKGRNNEF